MSLHHMLRAAAGNSAGPSDPYFEYNTLLLTGDGTNGAQNNTFLDSSTNNFTITRNGNTTQGTFSPYGNLWSNYFDGSGDWLVSSAPSMSGTWTVEAWIYRTVGSTNQSICFFNAGSAGSGVLIYITTNNYIQVNDGNTAQSDFTGATVPVNGWTHIAVVRNGTTTTGYVNGVSVGSHTFTPGSSSSVNIGYYASANPLPFTGYISNFRLVSGTAVYTSNFTPSTTPLTAVSGTSLLTCQSNRFIDNSSNNFTLTVNGNTSVQRFSPFNPTAPYSTATIGGSGYFDGTGDFLSVADNTALDLDRTTDWTVEAWFCKTASGSQVIIGSANLSGDSNWALDIDSSNLIRGYWINTGIALYNITSSSTVVLGAWYHVALVNNNSVMSLYVNGVSVGTPQTLTGTYRNLAASTSIGRTGDYAGLYFNGYISNLRIVKGTAVYTSAFTPPTSPVTAITNTSLLCNFTNAGIPDAAMMNDLETVGNAQVSTSVKKYGTGSLYFDGTGDYLYGVSNPNYQLGTGDFTIEFWAYLIGTSTDQILFDQRTVANQVAPTIYVGSNNLYFFVDTLPRISGSFTTTSTWVHIAVSRSGTSTKMFVNGVQIGSTYADSNNYIQNPVYVGARWDGTVALNGYIDDLRITKGFARYTANFTPPAQALPTY